LQHSPRLLSRTGAIHARQSSLESASSDLRRSREARCGSVTV